MVYKQPTAAWRHASNQPSRKDTGQTEPVIHELEVILTYSFTFFVLTALYEEYAG